MGREIQGSWLDAYMRYTEGQESPDRYHLWVGLGVLSAAVERNVWLDRGYYTLYPNLYIVLVGPPGVVHKSIAIKIGEGVLKTLPRKPTIIPQRVTVERMIQMLANSVTVDGTRVKPWTSGVISASELSVFLTKLSHEGGMLSVLSDLYDCPDEWSYETKGGGRDLLHKPYVTLLGGSTVDWLKDAIPGGAVGGGFLSRTLMIYADTPRAPVPHPDLTLKGRDGAERLTHDLAYISRLSGAFTWGPGAREWYADWYAQQREHIRESELSETLARKPDMCLKIAMLLSLAESDALRLEVPHMRVAAELLDDLEPGMKRVIGPILTRSEADVASRVRDVIERFTKITHSRLMALLWRLASHDDVVKAVETLEQAGIIRVTRSGKTRTYEWVGSTVEQTTPTASPTP